MTAERAIEILKQVKLLIDSDRGMFTALGRLIKLGLINSTENDIIESFFDSQKPSETCNTEFFEAFEKVDYLIIKNFVSHLIEKIIDNPEIIIEPREKQIA